MQKQGNLIDSDELRAFDAVATRRSFSLAAVDVGTSQSTVSQRIARLERRLNRRLVHRTTRKVSLTPDGEAMLIYARSILALSEEARLRLTRPGLKGVLKVGIEDEFARTRLPEVLGIFRTQFPDFGLKFITGRNEHLHDVLRSHEVDVILGKSHGEPDQTALWQEQLVWIGHHSLLLKPSDPVPLISYLKPSLTRSLTESALVANRRPWIDVAECSNLLGVLAAARSGLGVMAIGQSFRRTVLEEMPAEAGLPGLGKLTYVVECNSADVGSAADAFRDVLSEVAKRATAGL
ncbi:DNA-binding transcriptional LysR family regulator [Angulomicrobium tetraedrale]|uniref:DNA-binding transcriptional LysR family regulator n=1 Tax=Ancylobacter tetraedralis TaxID=217068 RepID=A0A839ZD68_9HYPH|nr:LysR family transcriptional regulator [Ancylobacter tetraedralis]MBB3772733.1 DNA-binding transcriptional LysR family regulator [Ancylobacter tetraedralis]